MLDFAIQRAQNLNALLPTNRQAADLDRGVDLEAELLGQVADALLGLGAVEEDAVADGLFAKDDVLGDGEDGHQHEVLMDHADPVG